MRWEEVRSMHKEPSPDKPSVFLFQICRGQSPQAWLRFPFWALLKWARFPLPLWALKQLPIMWLLGKWVCILFLWWVFKAQGQTEFGPLWVYWMVSSAMREYLCVSVCMHFNIIALYCLKQCAQFCIHWDFLPKSLDLSVCAWGPS